MPFVKGQSGNPKGKKPGTPNKTTRAVKEFLAELCDDPEIQQSVKAKVLAGETQSFFRALDKVVPDPPREIRVDAKVGWYVLPDGEDVAEA